MKAKIITIAALSLMMFTNLAFAQTSDLFTPVSTDKMMMILGSLFGQLGVFGGNTADPLMGVISIINYGSLTVAGMIVGYLILMSTIGSANDGEVMGKKHSVLMPVRVAIAVALVLPVNNGYNTIQALTGSVIVAGIGLADSAASKVMSQQNLQQVGSGSLSSPDLRNIGYKLFASYACMNMLKANTKDDILYKNVSIGLTKSSGVKNDIYFFGNTTESSGISKNACGQMEISKWKVPPVSTNGGIISTIIEAKDSAERMKVIAQENQKQTALLMQKMDTLSAKMVSTNSPVDPGEIENAIGAYKAAVNGIAAAQIASLDQFKNLKKSIDQDGFIMLGAYYQSISKLQDSVNSEMANIPQASGVVSFSVDSLSDKWFDINANLNKTSELSGSSEMNYGVGNASGGSNTSFFDSLKEFVTSGMNPTVLLKKLVTSESMKFDEKENILLKIERIGGWTLGIASSLWAGVGAISSTVGNAPGIGLFVVSTMIMVIPPLILFGFTCLYIIPFLPFLIWTGCIVAYLIACIEAIIGSSLWAVSMLAEGHEIMGQGANGYKQMLSLLLKPVLLVAGFAASVSVLNIFGSFMTAIFADVWNLSQTDSGFWTYLLGMFAMPFLYVTVALAFIKKCFDIMPTLADQIINWIGGAGASMSGHAKDFGGAIAGGGAIAAAALTSKGMSNSLSSKLADNKTKQADFDFKTANPSSREERMRNSDKAESSILDDLEGNNSFTGEKARSAINDAVDFVGGKDSAQGNEFMNQLKQSTERNPSKPLDQQIKSAMNAHFIDKFGSGSGRVIATAGNGAFSDEAEQTISVLSKAHDRLSSQGLSEFEAKDVISSANSKALESFTKDDESVKNNGDKTIKDFLVSELNKNLDDSNKFEEKEPVKIDDEPMSN